MTRDHREPGAKPRLNVKQHLDKSRVDVANSIVHEATMTRFRSRPLSEVATADDFCDCPRGVEARRWFNDRVVAPPGLMAVYEDCDECNPETGLLLYDGWQDAHTRCLTSAFFGRQTPPRTEDDIARVACGGNDAVPSK